MKFIRKIKVPKSNMFQKRVKLTQKLSFGFSLIVILLIIFLVVLKKSNDSVIKEFKKTTEQVNKIQENNSKAILAQLATTTFTNEFFKNALLLSATKESYNVKPLSSEAILGLNNFSETIVPLVNNKELEDVIKNLKTDFENYTSLKELETNYYSSGNSGQAEIESKNAKVFLDEKIVSAVDKINYIVGPLLQEMNIENTNAIDEINNNSIEIEGNLEKLNGFNISLISFILIIILIISLLSVISTKKIIANVLKNLEGLANLNFQEKNNLSNNKSFEISLIESAIEKVNFAIRSTMIEVEENAMETKKEGEKISETIIHNSSASEEVSASIFNIKENIHNSVNEIVLMANNAEVMAKESNDMIESFYSLKVENDEILSDTLKEKEIIKKTTENINGIAKEIEKSINEVEDLRSLSKEINTFINKIYEITEQTNLLALNAAIEAARAGEAGKGFAVVADEIRKLAGNSKNTAMEIENNISEISNRIDMTVKNSHENKEKMNGMNSEIEKIENVFDKVMEVLYNITKSLDGIYYDTKEQTEGINSLKNQSNIAKEIIEEISIGIEEINKAVGESTNSINDLIKVSEVLVENSEKLTGSISKFEL